MPELIGSSVNLISTLDGMGLVDTVNDLWIERLGPFSRQTAGDFVDAVFVQREIKISRATRKAILDSLGEPIPYLLSVFLTAILDRHRATGQPVTPSTVRAALEEDLLGGATAAVFHHYRSRLDEYYSPEDARASRALLALLSRSEEPVSESTLYALFLEKRQLSASTDAIEEMGQLMNQLENDFYVVSRDGHYAFFSRVLRLWWRAKYSFQGI